MHVHPMHARRMQYRSRNVRALIVTACLAAGCHGDGTTGNGATRSGQQAWRADVRAPSRTGFIAADSTHVYVYRNGLAISAIRLSDQTVAWTATSDETVDANFSLRGTALCAGHVIFGSQAAVYAVVPQSGIRRWKWRGSVGGLIGYGAPVCDTSTMYLSTGSPLRLYAVDAASGIERWVVSLDRQSAGNGFVRAPLVADGIVVACTREFVAPFRGMIIGLDATTGGERWRYEWDALPPSVNASCVSAAIAHGTVVATVDDGRVFALGLQNGQLRWTSPRLGSLQVSDDERPAFAVDSTVIIGSLRGVIVGLDIATGSERWRTSDPVEAIFAINRGFVGGQGRFFGINLSGWALAFDATTGRELWRAKPTSLDGRVLFGPGTLAGNRFVVIGSDGVYAFLQ